MMLTTTTTADPAPAPAATGRPNKAAHHLLSGATSGLASAVILQPLDLVKTRLQQGPLPFPAPVLDLRNGATPTTNIGGSGTAAAVAIGEVKGARVVGRGEVVHGSRIVPTVRRIVREEGVGALWRGTVPTVVRL
ncbi:hypothetical protein QFC21_006120 [Naganishia friedmannii]|uniref:Uncharacterized protein n=1 Tax=Naganishia friedmannii TaxID=89922 RepID=A0ACC2V528_9TREE|nr:hypothetical protein QFC21_006120 [Naganishia friedmannii]